MELWWQQLQNWKTFLLLFTCTKIRPWSSVYSDKVQLLICCEVEVWFVLHYLCSWPAFTGEHHKQEKSANSCTYFLACSAVFIQIQMLHPFSLEIFNLFRKSFSTPPLVLFTALILWKCKSVFGRAGAISFELWANY